MTELYSNLTPSSLRPSISRLTTVFGRRNSGMPYTSTPPPVKNASNTVTSKPLRASSPAQVMPDGPEPMTATFLPLAGFILGLLASSGWSPRKRSSWPMATGSLLTPRMHLPSHWVSCGQTRPQMAGSMDCSWMMSRPSPNLCS